MEFESGGWYSREYVPRFNGEAAPQLLTLHLGDAVPAELLDSWREDLASLAAPEAEAEWRRRLERYLDAGDGEAWLQDAQVADLVEAALLAFDADRYVLHGWVVMPNHLHALLTPFPFEKLPAIIGAWKSVTTREANRLLDRQGDFWCPEAYEQAIRSDDRYTRALAYIEQNPVKAGLCAAPADWRWSSASRRGNG